MLGNRVKKMLREQKWHEYIKEYKNPYDTWSNIRTSVNNAMGEFPLLTNLPKEKQEQLFTSENIKKILECLTSIDVSNSKKVEISAQLAIHGIAMCKKEYEKLNQDIPDISKLTSDHLDLAIRVCHDIAYKSITNSLEVSALEKKELFLFNWHKALRREKIRLDRFVAAIIKGPCVMVNLRYLKNKTIIVGNIEIPEENGSPPFELQIYPLEGKVSFRVNTAKTWLQKQDPDKKITRVRHYYEKKVKVIIDNNEFLLYKKNR